MITERSISPFERYGKAFPDADASLQIHVFAVTDTISAIAEKYYGDWRLWRVIAERNKIGDVRQIPTGTELVIPRRPLETGRYESA
jgi:nucleoid-associated protein YgaU